MYYGPSVWRQVSPQLTGQSRARIYIFFFPLADYICFGYLAKAVNLKSSTEPGISSGSMGDDDAQTDAPLPATLVRIPAEQGEKESE